MLFSIFQVTCLLVSGLPNEVDFAINVCCILSMEGTESLKLLSHRKLIDILLANVGLFSDQSDLSELYHKEWFPRSKRNFTRVSDRVSSNFVVSTRRCVMLYIIYMYLHK